MWGLPIKGMGTTVSDMSLPFFPCLFWQSFDRWVET